MIEPKDLYNSLAKQGVEFFTGVPDSLLKNFCAYINDQVDASKHIIAANEGASVGIAIGYHLATGKLPLVYMQNSGLGNSVNPLLSLADPDVYSVPMILLIGWRGQPGVKDEPQHIKQGRVMVPMLESMGIPFEVIEKDDSIEKATKSMTAAIKRAKEESTPVALLVEKNAFDSYKPVKLKESNFALNREEAIKLIVSSLKGDEAVVSTTGVTSRELFEYRKELGEDHSRDFLTVGGMGHASQIALGVALSRPERTVFCFDGDGATLMHMGSLAINGSLSPRNLKHIVFNNGAHDSVGGQPTVGFSIDLQKAAEALGYEKTYCAVTENEIRDVLKEASTNDKLTFIEIKVNKGFRSNLGRPTTTPIENKKALMEFLK